MTARHTLTRTLVGTEVEEWAYFNAANGGTAPATTTAA